MEKWFQQKRKLVNDHGNGKWCKLNRAVSVSNMYAKGPLLCIMWYHITVQRANEKWIAVNRNSDKGDDDAMDYRITDDNSSPNIMSNWWPLLGQPNHQPVIELSHCNLFKSSCLNCQIVLKFYTGHYNDSVELCVNLRNNLCNILWANEFSQELGLRGVWDKHPILQQLQSYSLSVDCQTIFIILKWCYSLVYHNSLGTSHYIGILEIRMIANSFWYPNLMQETKLHLPKSWR